MRSHAEWPEREVLRLEGFSDAVFAFALTLLVVSLEVPATFDELLHTLRAAPAFAVCFALFWVIWNAHHKFFRRYALADGTILALNATLLFVVLLYVYPLKFLFTLMLAPPEIDAIRREQIPTLMVIYSAGHVAVWAIFALMYRHVLKRRSTLQLTSRQTFQTRAELGGALLTMSVGVLSIGLAVLFPLNTGRAGYVYFLIGPAQWVYWRQVAKRRKRIVE